MKSKYFLLFATLYFINNFHSVSEELIHSIPSRKEAAHLDIEVTKLNTQILHPTRHDKTNKQIYTSDIMLNESQVLLLIENPEIFGALYSVNRQLPALKNIARQKNVSYEELENNLLAIKYENLPIELYAVLWNRQKNVVEKIYQFDLKNMSENSLEFHPISSYTTAKNSLEIELGEIILENSSNTLYELSTPVLSWTNSNGALKGELFIQNDKLFLRLESLEKIKNYMKPRVDNILIFPKDLKIISRENRSRSSTQSVNVGELLPDISLNSLFPSSQLVLTDIYGNLLNQVIISHGVLYSVDGNSSVSTTIQVQREGFLSTIFDPINAHDINVYVQGTSVSSGQSITVPLTSNSSNGAILNSSLSVSISTTTDFFGLIQNAQIDLGSNISPAAISKAYPGDYGATIEFVVEVE
jgi:hypothetical protein